MLTPLKLVGMALVLQVFGNLQYQTYSDLA